MRKLDQLRRDLKSIQSLKRRSSFGQTFDNQSFGNDPQQPKNDSRSLKRTLYNMLVASGVTVGSYVGYTIKQIIKLTIKYLGPIVLASVLIRYRSSIYKRFFTKSDQEKLEENIKKLPKLPTLPTVPNLLGGG